MSVNSSSFTIAAAAASQIAFTSSTSSTSAGTESANITATLEDAFGNSATRGTDVTLTPASSSVGTHKAFHDTSSATHATYTITAGTSSVSFRYYDEASGTYNITLTNDATSPTLTNPSPLSFTVNAVASDHLAFAPSFEPQNAVAGTSLGTVKVDIVDQFGNLVNDTSNVTVAIKSGTGAVGANLSGTATVAATAGVATFTGLSIDLASSGYQLHATDGSLTAGDSTNFILSAATPTKVAFTSATSSSTAGADSGVVTATLQDAFGNTATKGTNVVVTPASSSAGANKAFKTTGGSVQPTFTIAAGASSVSFKYYDELAGTYNVTLANDSSLTNPAALVFTVSAASATQLAFTSATSTSSAGANSAAITATLEDSYGNLATKGSDVNVTPASSSAGANKAFKTVGGTTQTAYTITAGSSSVSFRYYDEAAGTYNVTLGNDSSLSNPGALAFTVNPAAASQIALSGATGSTAGVNSSDADSDAAGHLRQRRDPRQRHHDHTRLHLDRHKQSLQDQRRHNPNQLHDHRRQLDRQLPLLRRGTPAPTRSHSQTTPPPPPSPTQPRPPSPSTRPRPTTSPSRRRPTPRPQARSRPTSPPPSKDQFGNTATRGTDVVVTPTSTSSGANKQFHDTSSTTHGTYTIPAGSSSVSFRYYDELAGTYNVTLANDSSLTNPAALVFTVNAAAADRVAFTSATERFDGGGRVGEHHRDAEGPVRQQRDPGRQRRRDAGVELGRRQQGLPRHVARRRTRPTRSPRAARA